MSNNNIIKGVFLVALGATSYGMLATFVKLAYKEDFTTAEVTSSQFIYGIIGILIINLFQRTKNKNTAVKASPKNILHLMLAGTSLGMTSVFYYLAVKYIPVSIGIAFAINIFKINFNDPNIDWTNGLFWGLLAATSFTTTMFTANKVALGISSAQRSLYMLLGGAVIVFGFSLYTQTTPFNFEIFTKWGIVLALFGTIIPPMLLNAGFPHTGIGLGSIVSSLELPVSVMMAFFLLNEEVLGIQWLGIALIILAIVIMNIQFKRK